MKTISKLLTIIATTIGLHQGIANAQEVNTTVQKTQTEQTTGMDELANYFNQNSTVRLGVKGFTADIDYDAPGYGYGATFLYTTKLNNTFNLRAEMSNNKFEAHKDDGFLRTWSDTEELGLQVNFSTAFEQNPHYNLFFGINGGVHRHEAQIWKDGKKQTDRKNTIHAFDRVTSATVRVDVGFEYMITPSWGIEGSVGYRYIDNKGFDATGGKTRDRIYEVNLRSIHTFLPGLLDRETAPFDPLVPKVSVSGGPIVTVMATEFGNWTMGLDKGVGVGLYGRLALDLSSEWDWVFQASSSHLEAHNEDKAFEAWMANVATGFNYKISNYFEYNDNLDIYVAGLIGVAGFESYGTENDIKTIEKNDREGYFDRRWVLDASLGPGVRYKIGNKGVAINFQVDFHHIDTDGLNPWSVGDNDWIATVSAGLGYQLPAVQRTKTDATTQGNGYMYDYIGTDEEQTDTTSYAVSIDEKVERNVGEKNNIEPDTLIPSQPTIDDYITLSPRQGQGLTWMIKEYTGITNVDTLLALKDDVVEATLHFSDNEKVKEQLIKSDGAIIFENEQYYFQKSIFKNSGTLDKVLEPVKNNYKQGLINTARKDANSMGMEYKDALNYLREGGMMMRADKRNISNQFYKQLITEAAQFKEQNQATLNQTRKFVENEFNYRLSDATMRNYLADA